MTATRRPLLVATVGLPGSGKSTWARWYQEVMNDGRPTVVVERDVIRDMLGYRWDAHPDMRGEWERVATRIQGQIVHACLAEDVDVVCSDTNLVDEHVDALRQLAHDAGARFEVRSFLDVPIEECVRLDALRPPYEPGGPCSGRSVGAEVIRGMWGKYVATHPGASGDPDVKAP